MPILTASSPFATEYGVDIDIRNGPAPQASEPRRRRPLLTLVAVDGDLPGGAWKRAVLDLLDGAPPTRVAAPEALLASAAELATEIGAAAAAPDEPAAHSLGLGAAAAALERRLLDEPDVHTLVLHRPAWVRAVVATAVEGIEADAGGPAIDAGTMSVLTRHGAGDREAVVVNVDPLDPLRAARSAPEGRLYLMRHGECAIPTADGLMHSHCDFPLTERGRRQAELAGARFRELGPLTRVASPIARADETARLIAGDEPVELVDGLAEIRIGDYEGVAVARLFAEQPGFMRDSDARLPGGESLADVAERAWDALSRTLAGAGESTVLAVAHGATNRALLGRMFEIPLDHALRLRQDWGAVTILERRSRRWRLATLNWSPIGLAELEWAGAAYERDASTAHLPPAINAPSVTPGAGQS